MSIIIFVICIFFILLALFVDKRLYSPPVLFNFWWGITILISGLGLFGIYIPSINTYLIMLVCIISFNISCFTILIIQKKRAYGFAENTTKDDIKPLLKYVIIIQLFVICELSRRSLKVLTILAAGFPYEVVRYEYFWGDKIISGYEQVLGNYFVTPVIYFSIILFSLLHLEKKYNKYLLLTTSLCVGLFAFSSGGRGIILIFGLSMAMAYFIKNRQLNISKKIWILLLTGISIYFLVFITILRSGSDENGVVDLLRTVILYYTSPYIYFDKISHYALQNNVLLLGGAFFGGIIDIFIYILRFFGLDTYTMQSHIAMYNQISIQVGNNLNFNAFPTMVYTFLCDFNYLGIILGPMMFAFIAMISYKKMLMTNRLSYKGIYIMIIIMIYESVMTWVGIHGYPWAVISMFLILNYFSNKKYRFLV